MSGSFEVEGLSSDLSCSFEVEGLSDFSELESLSEFKSSPTTMIAPFLPGWLDFFFFGDLSA
jgi:hypothetical protein